MPAALANVCVVDLGGGNIRSVVRALESLGTTVQLTSAPKQIENADRVVVPGQGAFGDGTKALRELGIGDALQRFRERERPFFGVCIGMQLLFASSEEAPEATGLGWIDGSVRKFKSGPVDSLTGLPLKVPHMGWNLVRGRAPWFASEDWFYFVHSYYCDPSDDSVVAARCEYGENFCAALAQNNIFACQFHPEKSHDAGWKLLRTWLET